MNHSSCRGELLSNARWNRSLHLGLIISVTANVGRGPFACNGAAKRKQNEFAPVAPCPGLARCRFASNILAANRIVAGRMKFDSKRSVCV